MIGDLLKRLAEPDPAPLVDADARLALGALLVRVAKIDGHYHAEEAAVIDKLLARRYKLGPFEVTSLRREAEEMEAAAPDTVRFTRAIKDAVPYDDRLSVLEALWAVVLADGVRDSHENSMLRLVANLLGINDRDSNLARKRVEAGQV